jgi:restriction system protein
MAASQNVVRTPFFPEYGKVRKLMDLWRDTTKKSAARSLIYAVYNQTGTPQDPVDWSDPDTWIDERLAGEDRELAHRIWDGSGKAVNPRHLYGTYLFINNFGLLEPDAAGIYRLTGTGAKFLADDDDTVRRIDEAEGIPKILAILATNSPARRGDLLPAWQEYLLAHSKYRAESVAKSTLRQRIRNLVARGLIGREGNTYAITDRGLAYATEDPTVAVKPDYDVLRAIKAFNDAQISTLRERLGNMPPYEFEGLVKDLLEAMEYEDVIVTKQSGDKGVDVVANYEFGITQIREVVQVKRHQGSITRPVLDQLRGVLPFYQAIRGTIITIGRFAQGCKDAAFFPGAAPITLIDGDKLIELLLKHEIGIKRRPQTLLELDESYFSQSEAGADSDELDEITGAREE